MPLERNSRKIMARLKREGWTEVSCEGSHHKMRHPDKTFPIVVPHPKKDIAPGTARQIAKQAGWLE